jgi:type I restriction enzyme S subunit
MPEWITSTIAEIADRSARSIAIGPFGSALKAEVYSRSGIPVVRGQDITVGKSLSSEDRVYVPEEVAAQFPACIVREGDLVFPHRGAIGRVGIVGNEKLLISSSLMKLSVDKARFDPLFVFYYFRWRGRDELLARASTVGTPGIGQPLASLRSIPITYPPLSSQRAIAELLGALDDKIAANTATVGLVAALAQALVQRASTGCPPVALSSITTVITRGITPRYTTGEGWTVLNQKCVRDHEVNPEPARVTEPKASAADRLLRSHDLLVNSTGQGTLGRTARWTAGPETVTVDSHITIVRFDRQQVDPAFAGIAALPLDSQIELLAEGSTGQTELRRDLLGALRLRLPDLATQERVGIRIRQQDALVSALRFESVRLAATRDELLPLLMSGRLSVRDAERAVENFTSPTLRDGMQQR